MRWKGRRQSENVEDVRGSGGGMKMGGGLLAVVLALVAMYFGVPPQLVQLFLGGGQQGAPNAQQGEPPQPDEKSEFLAVILADTEDVWAEILPQEERVAYQPPKLVRFSGSVPSGCGFASAASGPFYCPADSKVYLDTQFFDELARRFGAPGDFAQAYVIAHEVGHHVQHLLGITDKVHSMKGRVSEAEYNELSVRLELQADFFAGVWAHHAQKRFKILEPGDIDEALEAASAIGDDTLQKQAQGYVVPESFTHGTSAQRVKWFRRGFETGDLELGDTFNATDL